VLVAALLSVGETPARAQEGDADALVKRGIAALEAKDAEAAVRALEQARALAPGKAEVCYQLARAYEADGQAPNALALYGEAARLGGGGAASAAAQADERRLRARWIEVELSQGDEYRAKKRFRDAQESYVNAFEIADASDAAVKAKARERYAQAASAEIAEGVLRNRAAGGTCALLPARGVEPGSPLADLAALVEDEIARRVKAGGMKLLPASEAEAAQVRVTGTLGTRLVLQAIEAGKGGEVLAQVGLRTLEIEGEKDGRTPASDTPSAATADLARRLADAIAAKAPGATVALRPLSAEGDPRRAAQVKELMEQLLGIELAARAEGRFRLLPRGGDKDAGVVVDGAVIAGDPLATVRLEARRVGSAERPFGRATTTFACPATTYGAPLQLDVEVHGQTVRDGRYVDVQVYPGMPLREGDQVQVRFRVSRPCYVYVLLYSSGTNSAARVFPDAKIRIDNFARPGAQVVLPAPDLWFVLDDAVGAESLYVIAADEPLDDLDRLLLRVEEGGIGLARELAQRRAEEALMGHFGTRGFAKHAAKSKTEAETKPTDAKALAASIKADGRVVWTMSIDHVK